MDKNSEWIIKELKILEDQKKWDDCIEFFKKNLKNLKNKKYLYICINYFFMNLLLEEGIIENDKKELLYHYLSIKYFNQSYKIFKNDPEYLYLSGIAIFPSPWFFGNYSRNFPEMMIEKALKLKPYSYFSRIEYFCKKNWGSSENNQKKLKNFCLKYLNKEAKITKELRRYGSFGEYLIETRFRYHIK